MILNYLVRRMRLYAFLMLLAFAFFPQRSFTQRYFVKTYTETDGLSSSMVYNIAQDSNGLMWFATRTGVSSYDGLNFKNYSIRDGLLGQSYSFVKYDQKGKLWALSSEGIMLPCLFDGTKWLSKFITCPFNKRYFYSCFEVNYTGNKLEMAFGTSNDGLFLYQNGKWEHFDVGNGLLANRVYDAKFHNQSLYIATAKGMSVLKNGKISKMLLPELENVRIMALSVDTSNSDKNKYRLYILTEEWAGFVENFKITKITNKYQFNYQDPGWNAFIKPDNSGGFYYGSPFFVNHYTFKTAYENLLDKKSGLISDGATDIFIDRESNTWFSGYRGITKIPSRRFSSYTSENGLFNDEVASAIELSPGKYAFGHYGAISFFENNKFTHLILIPSEEKRKITSRILELAQDKRGNIWAAVSSQGLARINKDKNVTWFREPEGVSKITNSIICTPAGRIYAATSTAFLEFENNEFKHILLKKTGKSSIRKIFVGPANSIYIATLSAGIIEYKDKVETVYKSQSNPFANSIYGLYIDSHNTKWVGTAAGLYYIEGSVLQNANKKNINIDRPVFIILGDKLGNLWFGTDNGIYKWDGHKLEHFTVRDGLSGQELNRSGGIVDSKNHIWFGTNNGLTLYQPEFEYKIKEIPPPIVRLRYLTVGKDSLALNKSHNLHNTENNLTFHISITSLINEKNVIYKYIIQGSDTSWSEEIPYTTDAIVFTNLEPGSYNFCIKAKNAAGIWSIPVCAKNITINPPLFFRWWFICLAAIFLIVGVFAIGRFIFVSRYNKRLETTVAERTRALIESEEKLRESNAAKDKFFSIIAHDLKSPFNALLGMLDILTSESYDLSPHQRKKILLDLRTSAKRTFSLLNNLLTWSRAQKGIIPFLPSKYNIEDIIHDTVALSHSAALAKNIMIETRLEDGLEIIADRNMIQTVIRNILSNAIKFTDNGGNITISSEKINGNIVFSIKDTGHGMTPEYVDKLFKIDELVVSKDTNNETGTGLGLILCKDFVNKHNGNIEVNSEPGKGSTFIISLPVNNSSN